MPGKHGLLRIAAAVVAAMVLSGVPAAAQEGQPKLTLPNVVFAGAASADWTSTYYATSRMHFREDNPLLTNLSDQPTSLVLAGGAIDAAGMLLWNRLVGRTHPRLAAAGLYVGAAFRVGLASRNLARIQRAQRLAIR